MKEMQNLNTIIMGCKMLNQEMAIIDLPRYDRFKKIEEVILKLMDSGKYSFIDHKDAITYSRDQLVKFTSDILKAYIAPIIVICEDEKNEV